VCVRFVFPVENKGSNINSVLWTNKAMLKYSVL